MIFYDKDTAIEFRAKAMEEMNSFIFDIMKSVRKYPNASDDSVKSHIEQKIQHELPKNLSILLHRSGLVFPADGSGIYPVNLYYDDMDRNDNVIIKFDGLNGGIKNGEIHT